MFCVGFVTYYALCELFWSFVCFGLLLIFICFVLNFALIVACLFVCSLVGVFTC